MLYGSKIGPLICSLDYPLLKDGYAGLALKEYKPGWQKAEPVERVYFKYDPKNNLPTHKATLPNQIDREVKALTSDVCVTIEANQNLTPSQKELL